MRTSRLLTSISLAVFAAAARAENLADFYRGRTVTLLIGYEPGGGYDLYGRAVARFIGKHIPGRSSLDNLPGIGDGYRVRHLAGNLNIMRNQQQTHAALIL